MGFFKVIIRWQVFAPMLGAIGCTAGILKLWSSSAPLVPWLNNRILIGACAVIGLWAITVAVNEGSRIYKRSVARKKLGSLYQQGQRIYLMFSSPLVEDRDKLAFTWIKAVESVIRGYLDDSYISRFDVPYPKELDGKIHHAEIFQRLESLEEFMHELQIAS